MNKTQEIITSREQVTPEWLSNTLALADIRATVKTLEVTPIVAGYYGSSSRLVVTYEEDDDALPRSFFLKMATEHLSARTKAALSGMYRYEVGFYQQLADRVNISTPRCYAAEITDDHSAFILLLEDAAPLTQPDQLQGLSLDQSKLAIQELAGLHASTWQGNNMEDCDWAVMNSAYANGLAESMVTTHPLFMERFGDQISEQNCDILQCIVNKITSYWSYLLSCKNQASTHCDFRADNMLFGRRNGALAMIAIDWVGTLSGTGRDLGHFIGTSLLPGHRRVHEIELLELYHSTLIAQGVADFSLSECIDDYRINLIYPIFVVVTSAASVDLDQRGMKLFLSMFDRSCQAIKDSNAMDVITEL